MRFFYDHIVLSGIIAFHGYGVKLWEEESKAVDEFLKVHKVNSVF